MDALWPWLGVAGAGALHGLNPASGWMFAAACGVRDSDRRRARRALVSIALGHAAAIAFVAAAVVQGLSMDRRWLQAVAGVLLIGIAAWRLRPPRPCAAFAWRATGDAGIALWSFLIACVHGAGLMLVPALLPLCLGTGPAARITASGSGVLALAAVAVHLAAMLAVTASVMAGLRRWLASTRIATPQALQRGWIVLLAATGVALIALR